MCIEIVTSVFRHTCQEEGMGLLKCLLNRLNHDDGGSYDSIGHEHPKVKKSRVSLGDRKCKSSRSCSGGIFGAMNFDCSNVWPGFRVDNCPIFDCLENYRENHGHKGIWPRLEVIDGKSNSPIVL
jgi:hypothetical protein